MSTDLMGQTHSVLGAGMCVCVCVYEIDDGAFNQAAMDYIHTHTETPSFFHALYNKKIYLIGW